MTNVCDADDWAALTSTSSRDRPTPVYGFSDKVFRPAFSSGQYDQLILLLRNVIGVISSLHKFIPYISDCDIFIQGSDIQAVNACIHYII